MFWDSNHQIMFSTGVEKYENSGVIHAFLSPDTLIQELTPF